MDLQAALQARDFAAAQTLLRYTGLPKEAEEQWRAYLLFHSGLPGAAAEVYRSLGAGDAASGGKSFDLHLASCLFQLGRHQEAHALAGQGPDCPLKTRLLAHSAAKLQGAAAALDSSPAAAATAAWEEQLAAGKLDDQLSLAALLYARNDYEAAAAIYGNLLQQFPDLHALRVYLALCCYMLDDWQGSSTHVAAYQAAHPDSILAANIRACNEFRAGGAAAALASLGSLPYQLAAAAAAAEGGAGAAGAQLGALIRHNAVVFGDGQGGMQVLPPLVGIIPEARLNLVLCYCCRRGDPARALHLLRGLEPGTAFEHICQGVACALQGQATGSLEQLRAAQESLTAVGTSSTEQDTVPGRQCMASALLLGGQPGEALPYLESIAEVCGVGEDDSLSWNLGAARAACGQWAAAAEALQAVQAPELQEDPTYQSWLARCLVRAGQPEQAWQLYLQAQQRLGAAPSVADLLHLLAGDCFQAGEFLWAARAFHALEYLQQQGVAAPAAAALGGGVWEGKRATCVAVFREVVHGRQEAGAVLPELLGMLRGGAGSNPQAHAVASAVRQWAREHASQALPEPAA